MYNRLNQKLFSTGCLLAHHIKLQAKALRLVPCLYMLARTVAHHTAMAFKSLELEEENVFPDFK